MFSDARINSVIITLLWKWGVNEDKKKKSWSTIANWPPFTPLLSDYRLHSFYVIYILSSSLECLVKNWKYVYECVTMSNMYQEKTNKESVLFVAGIAWCSFASHLCTTHGRKNIITHGTPSLRDGIIYIHIYEKRERENAIVQLISDSFHVVLIEWVSWAELIVDYRHRHRLYHIRSNFDDWIWQVAPTIEKEDRRQVNI
jgi:hypothetical protein